MCIPCVKLQFWSPILQRALVKHNERWNIPGRDPDYLERRTAHNLRVLLGTCLASLVAIYRMFPFQVYYHCQEGVTTTAAKYVIGNTPPNEVRERQHLEIEIPPHPLLSKSETLNPKPPPLEGTPPPPLRAKNRWESQKSKVLEGGGSIPII